MKLYPLPSRHEKDAMDTAHRMRAVMAGEDEELTSSAVKELHAQLNQQPEIYQAAWGHLASNERTMWKLYKQK